MSYRALLILCLGGSLLAPGCWSQDDVGASVPWFTEESADRGLDFEHSSGHDRKEFYFPEIHAGGAALFDADQDGDLDAYLVQSGRLLDSRDRRPGNQLFLNQGSGRFRNASEASGADDRGYGMGVTVGDYDGDRLTDIYVTNVGSNVLLRNLGEGKFEDVTDIAGVGMDGWSASAAFVDFDLDGDLDLFVANYLNWTVEGEVECFDTAGRLNYCGPATYDTPAADVLYRNMGDGTFEDATEAAGLAVAFGTGLGVAIGDIDENGWPDIFVANDNMLDQLWLNQGDGTFRDEAVFRGCAADSSGQPKAGMGVGIADVDNDGDLDLLVCNLGGQTDSLFLNQGDYFLDSTGTTGLAALSRSMTRFGLGWVDFNNDGLLDIYQANGAITTAGRIYDEEDTYAQPNLLFQGLSDLRYREVLPRGGTEKPLISTSRAAAFGDIDGDGGVDVLVVNRDTNAYLLINRAPERGNWLRVRLLSSRGAPIVGGTVIATVGSVRSRRENQVAYSYQSANEPTAHFGLGSDLEVDRLEVRWPDGTRRCLGPQKANQVLEISPTDGIACP